MTSPQISLVIPAWNEAALLPRLLDSVDVAHRRWIEAGHPADAIEVILADNGSSDATVQIASECGCTVATIEKRVIAAVRNGGAAMASGEVLAFIDADSILHPDSFIAVATAMANPRAAGGTSGVVMERWSIGIALTYAMMMSFVWLTGMDTGLVFWRRADFEALGGYDERRMAAEDSIFWCACAGSAARAGNACCDCAGSRPSPPPASSTSTATGTISPRCRRKAGACYATAAHSTTSRGGIGMKGVDRGAGWLMARDLLVREALPDDFRLTVMSSRRQKISTGR